MTGKNGNPFVVVHSPSMERMAKEIFEYWKLGKEPPTFHHFEIQYNRFACGEFVAKIPETVRRQHVFFIHGLHPHPNEEMMKMFLAMDAMRRADVADITLVVPFLPYMRQDRKDQPRVPISARMFADMIEANKKVSSIITADLHSEQEEGFFSIPVNNMNSRSLFADHAKNLFGGDLSDVVVVSPDFGSAKRNRKFAEKLGSVPVAIFEKRRPQPGKAEVASVIGESVKGKRVVIYDDMIDTGGTIFSVVTALKKMGAREVFVFATHGIFSGTALKNLRSRNFHVTVTDSIARSKDFLKKHSYLKQVSLVPFFADAIHEASLIGGSISRIND